jgi:hypothetical protein
LGTGKGTDEDGRGGELSGELGSDLDESSDDQLAKLLAEDIVIVSGGLFVKLKNF